MFNKIKAAKDKFEINHPEAYNLIKGVTIATILSVSIIKYTSMIFKTGELIGEDGTKNLFKAYGMTLPEEAWYGKDPVESQPNDLD